MPALTAPLEAGGLSLRNRLVATAHGSGLVRDGLALEGDAAYWGRVARGGVAMAIIGGTIVAPESGYRGGNVFEAYREDAIAGLRARAEAIKAEGAVAVQQLVHLGRETLGAPSWYAPVAPSAVRSPREPVPPRALRADEIGGVVDAFTRSARHGAVAGFDGVELHAAHGYLIAQFLSAESNRRTDGYGGGRGPRVRLLEEIVAAIRALEHPIAIGVRLSVEPGLDIDELAQILATLQEKVALDWVNLTVGPRGDYVRDMGTDTPPLLGQFAPIRKAAACSLIVSQAFRARHEIETALAEGADLVGVARPLIADPDFPRKLLDDRDDEIRPCVSCNEDCRLFDPALLCSVNPDLALPGEHRRRANPIVLQQGRLNGGPVAILGGGVAGLECALTLARGGRKNVVLFEGDEEIGGDVALAARAPHRTGWRRIVDFYARALESSGIEIRLGAPAAEETLAGFDEIVVAIGADEGLPEIEGIEHAVSSSDALEAGRSRFAGGEQVVVVDDGFGWWPCVSAVELAIAGGAARIAVLTPSGSFATGIPAEARTQLMPRLEGARIETHSFLVPVAVGPDGVTARHRFSDELESIAADVVIFVGERRPATPGIQLPPTARVQAIGDAVVPRRASHAITEGRAAAEAILAIRNRTTSGRRAR